MILELNFMRVCPRCGKQLTTDNEDITRCPVCMSYVKPLLVNASASGKPESEPEKAATSRKERA